MQWAQWEQLLSFQARRRERSQLAELVDLLSYNC
jgi:hypothetical protein